MQLADLGSHRLAYAVDGQENRKEGQPILIVLPGLTSNTKAWAAVRRLLNGSLPVFWYDRAGYGESEESPNEPTSANVVAELSALLKATNVLPPYILVGHSWGGTIAREFLELRSQDVIGAMLCDHQCHLLPDPEFYSLLEGVDLIAEMQLKDKSALTPEEWQAFIDEEIASSTGDRR